MLGKLIDRSNAVYKSWISLHLFTDLSQPILKFLEHGDEGGALSEEEEGDMFVNCLTCKVFVVTSV